MSDWKDLEIGNIKEFVERDVFVEKWIRDMWCIAYASKASIVYDVVEPTISTKYRYRLTPLKPIIVYEENISNINYDKTGNIVSMTVYPNSRPVEIIE